MHLDSFILAQPIDIDALYGMSVHCVAVRDDAHDKTYASGSVVLEVGFAPLYANGLEE